MKLSLRTLLTIHALGILVWLCEQHSFAELVLIPWNVCGHILRFGGHCLHYDANDEDLQWAHSCSVCKSSRLL
jgi:hypothetical protein